MSAENAKRVSKQSKISFILTLFSFLIILFFLILRNTESALVVYAPLIINICIVLSTVFSIIDLKNKKSLKTLSIVTLILDMVYLAIIILGIIIVALGLLK